MIIGGQCVGHGEPVFTIADLSGNHLNSFSRAIALIFAARKAGVSAVKLQIYDPHRMAIRRGGSIDAICNEQPWVGRKFVDLYLEAYTPREWYSDLSAFHSCMFASVFDVKDVEYLEPFNPPAYKIASREAADIELVTAAAKTGKPLIISTGTATNDQLGLSIAAAAKHTNQIALLYCVSQYPASLASIDFDQIGILRHKFQIPVGFSDHTLGIDAALMAVEMGACIIEKHLTLKRSDGGPDADFSLEPEEFAELVRRVKDVH